MEKVTPPFAAGSTYSPGVLFGDFFYCGQAQAGEFDSPECLMPLKHRFVKFDLPSFGRETRNLSGGKNTSG